MTPQEHKEYLETIKSACCGVSVATQDEGLTNRCTECNEEDVEVIEISCNSIQE